MAAVFQSITHICAHVHVYGHIYAMQYEAVIVHFYGLRGSATVKDDLSKHRLVDWSQPART